MDEREEKAQVGKRLTGQSDPKDPDGLITLDDPASTDQDADMKTVSDET